jgi:hypothetical protein
MRPVNNTGNITSAEDLKKELIATRLRIQVKENELRSRFREVPGELFYSGVDSVLPSIISGKVSSLALTAGKGLINNFFVRKAVSAGTGHLLKTLKPSGIIRKVTSGIGSLIKKKK